MRALRQTCDLLKAGQIFQHTAGRSQKKCDASSQLTRVGIALQKSISMSIAEFGCFSSSEGRTNNVAGQRILNLAERVGIQQQNEKRTPAYVRGLEKIR